MAEKISASSLGKPTLVVARFIFEDPLVHLVEARFDSGWLSYRWLCGTICSRSAFKIVNETVTCLECLAKAT